MSLLDYAMKTCTMLDKSTSPDGQGGIHTEWKEGATFGASIALDTSMIARIAEQQGVKSLYTVVTKENVVLRFHDVFRTDDGKIYRVTSDGEDKVTPKISTLKARQVTAEEWQLA